MSKTISVAVTVAALVLASLASGEAFAQCAT